MGYSQSAIEKRMVTHHQLPTSTSQPNPGHRPTRKISFDYGQEGLIELTDPNWKDRPGKFRDVDVVAIHGLNGNPISTWEYRDKDQSSYCFWLRDLLPVSLPGARVFTYGYNSGLFLSHSVENMNIASATLLTYLALERSKIREVCTSAHVFSFAHPLALKICTHFCVGRWVDPRSRLLLHGI